MAKSRIRIAALSDIHYGRADNETPRRALASAAEVADVLILCGDLTNFGLKEEADCLAVDIGRHVNIPTIAVWGNHDFESDQLEAMRQSLEGVDVTLLDGNAAEVRGVGFAGVSGFGGGFGKRMINAWGEPLTKQFVQAGVDEALKLEKALSTLHTPHKVVLLHYSPVVDTVQGEPRELYPFLGCSRLEEPINRLQATVAFHGHAHHGTPQGRTGTGVPVFNVALPVLQRAKPKHPPFVTYEFELP